MFYFYWNKFFPDILAYEVFFFIFLHSRSCSPAHSLTLALSLFVFAAIFSRSYIATLTPRALQHSLFFSAQFTFFHIYLFHFFKRAHTFFSAMHSFFCFFFVWLYVCA